MKERRTVVVAWLFCLSLLAVGVVPIATATDSWGTQGVQQIGSSNGGNVTTAVELGGNGTDRIRAVAKTAEGGAVLVGQTDSFGGNTDGWVVSLDSDGNERWNRTVGGPGFETFSGLHATADGEYVAVGSTRSTVDGSTDVYAAKFDGDGDVVWADSYGGPRYDEAHAVVAADGGYTLAGATRSRGRGGLSGWVLHLDESGVPAWNQTYGSVADDVANDIDATGDGYVIAGATESGSATSDAWILRLGPDGQQRWERAVGKQRPTTAGAVVPLDNTDGYVVVGSQAPGGGGPTDAWVTRIDADGTSVWNRTYGGDGPDTAVDAALTDGTPAFVGTTTTGDGTRDPWLVKLGTNGRQRSVTVVQTDGRERIRTLAGRDRQFAVVGSTDERNAQGVFFRVTAVPNTTTTGDDDTSETDDQDSGGSDTEDDDSNPTGGSDVDGGSGPDEGRSSDRTDGSVGGEGATSTDTPTQTATSTGTVTPTQTATSTGTVTPTQTATPTVTPDRAATTTTAATPLTVPQTPPTTSTPTAERDDTEPTTADRRQNGGAQPPSTTTTTTSGTGSLFGHAVVFAVTVGLLVAGYQAKE